MPIDVTCPGCFQVYSVKDTLAGKKIRCKECQGVIEVVPETASEEELKTIPPPRPARTGTPPVAMGKRQGKAQTTAGRGRWDDVPWKSAGIPAGITIALYLLSHVLPRGGVVVLVDLLLLFALLGCGFGGLYMLTRVSSRLGKDLSYDQARNIRRAGRMSGDAGGSIVLMILTFGLFYVFTKGMIIAPKKTIPWFLVMAVGLGGLAWIVTYERDRYTQRPTQTQNSGNQPWTDDDWKKWEEGNRIKVKDR